MAKVQREWWRGRCTVELYEYRLLTTVRSERGVSYGGLLCTEGVREQDKEVECFEKEVNGYV